MPYAGRIHVSGRTTRAVQSEIEHALEGKAIQPQVLVNVTHTVGDTVSVGGEVAAGARVPLSVKGDRLLDVLASAGRRARAGQRDFRRIVARVEDLPHSAHHDRQRPAREHLSPSRRHLTLVRDPQKFIAYGATGQNAEIPFDADGVTLAEALAKAGGLQDSRSDPRGVFVFRYELEFGRAPARPEEPARPARAV